MSAIVRPWDPAYWASPFRGNPHTEWVSPTKRWEDCTPERQAKLRAAWSAGNLRWKLDPSQQAIYDHIYASHKRVKSSLERVYCMDVSRQSGKDFTMSVICIEQIMRRRGLITRIPYAAPTKENVQELLVPTFEGIFADCPPELVPYEIEKGTFRTNSPELNWPWGGRIVLVGVDLHPGWLRGPATFCMAVTEPGFMDDLDEIIDGVLLPQLLTQPQGFCLMGSTPPVTPGHPWSQKYIPAAKVAGMYSKRTIFDCPRFPDEQIIGTINKLGGIESNRVRREMLCEHIIDTSLAVVPEFVEARKVMVTTEGFDTPPAFRDTYVSMDPGFAHATGSVYGYLDFERGIFMVEADFATQGLNSNAVARKHKAREWQLWGRAPKKPKKLTEEAWAEELELIKREFYTGEWAPPARGDVPVVSWRDGKLNSQTFRRVSDTDARLIADMSNEHGLVFTPTDKDDTEAACNAMRLNVQNLKYRIHPRCVNLITHLEQGTWNKQRTKLAESKGGGHFDCLKAFEYLNRNVLWGRNPFPPHTYDRHNYHVPNGRDKTDDALNNLFRPPKRGRARGRGRR